MQISNHTSRRLSGTSQARKILAIAATAAISCVGCKANAPWHTKIYAVKPTCHQMNAPPIQHLPASGVPTADNYPAAPLGGEGLSEIVPLNSKADQQWSGAAEVEVAPNAIEL